MRKQLTLLSPATWDDGNDRHYLERFETKHGSGAVTALCFSEASETYHHWSVFTSGSDGVCVEFDSVSLLRDLPDSVESGPVSYVEIGDIANEVANWKRWPFIKRYPYRDEKEFRLIHIGDEPGSRVQDFEISLETVRKVTTSPWLHESLHQVVRDLIHSINGCEKLSVHQTKLVDYQRWKDAIP